MDPLKTYFLLNMGILYCYVSLPESIICIEIDLTQTTKDTKGLYFTAQPLADVLRRPSPVLISSTNPELEEEVMSQEVRDRKVRFKRRYC